MHMCECVCAFVQCACVSVCAYMRVCHAHVHDLKVHVCYYVVPPTSVVQ